MTALISAPMARVLGLLDRVKKSGGGYEARCPGSRHQHEDKHPSLSVGLGSDSRVLLNCHAGCPADEVLAALHLEWGDLFEKSREGNPIRRFRLLDSTGEVVAEHVREDVPGDKKLWWESHGKRGLNGTPVTSLPLYHLPEVLADLARPVVLTEGEKAADALIELGLLAAATVTGAGATPSAEVLSVLQGREVWLWPDNDEPGQSHMQRIAGIIRPAPRWIDWPSAPAAGDAADYVAAGGTAAAVSTLLRQVSVALPSGPRIWTASELAVARFDAVRWAIPGLLPAGLAILAGRPKLGKSWLALGWAIDVARGSLVLKKMDVVQGDTLYLALEDGPQRMQERIALMLGDWKAPAKLHIATEWPRTDEGGLDLLAQFLAQHPETRLIVVDTFKRVRPKEKNTQRLYDLDYDAIAPMAALARQYNVAIVVVFHTRKGVSDDPLEMVSGTLGLSGAADCVLVLKRERGEADASLFITGRDVEEQDLALRWEKEDVLAWSLLGNADQFRVSRERQQILEAIATVPGMKPFEIAGAIGKPAAIVRRLLFSMVRDGEVRNRDGHYLPATDNSPPRSIGNVGNVSSQSVTASPPRSAVSVTPIRLPVTDTRIPDVTDVTDHGQNGDACRWCGRAMPHVADIVCKSPEYAP